MSLEHDDYCRIFGRVIFDAFYRIAALEQQLTPLQELHANFKSQNDVLRTQLAEAKRELADLKITSKT